jgi:hypothetical protein
MDIPRGIERARPRRCRTRAGALGRYQPGCFQPTCPDEYAAVDQLAVGEPEAFLGCGGDRRVGADLDPQVREDSGGLVDQLG